MSISVTNQIKSFRYLRTGNRYPFVGHWVILKPISDYSNSSNPINIMAYLSPVPDTYWYPYYKDCYIGKIDTLYIHIEYTSEINKVAINPRGSRQYDTSNPCAMCENTGHTFDECEIKKHDFLKRH